MEYDELGAMAFILVGFVDGSIYKVDINDWANMKETFGRKYIKQEELEEIACKVTRGKNGIRDFLKEN